MERTSTSDEEGLAKTTFICCLTHTQNVQKTRVTSFQGTVHQARKDNDLTEM